MNFIRLSGQATNKRTGRVRIASRFGKAKRRPVITKIEYPGRMLVSGRVPPRSSGPATFDVRSRSLRLDRHGILALSNSRVMARETHRGGDSISIR